MNFSLASGEGLSLLGYEKERIQLLCPRPFPPGSPVELSFATELGAHTLSGKTQRCRKVEGGFHLDLRLISLPRSVRLELEALVVPQATSTPQTPNAS